MINKDAIRHILADRKIYSDAINDLADDAELTLDSLAVVWLSHRLEEDHGVVLDPSDLVHTTSINQIYAIALRPR